VLRLPPPWHSRCSRRRDGSLPPWPGSGSGKICLENGRGRGWQNNVKHGRLRDFLHFFSRDFTTIISDSI
jgi:hypothetical protein